MLCVKEGAYYTSRLELTANNIYEEDSSTLI